MGDYLTLIVGEYTSSIVSPSIQVDSFKINICFLNMVQREKFGGLLSKDPTFHKVNLLQLYDTIKIRGVTQNFPFFSQG